jgi:DNA polymerase-1
MERRGINIDVEKCLVMTERGQFAMEDIKEILGLNPGSRNDLEALLIDRLNLPVVKRSAKTGQPSFDKEAMIEYEAMLEWRNSPIADLILTYRGWQKAVSSCYIPYVTKRSTIDGKLRCNYKMHGTKTGRSSCADPNLQQIPRSGDKEWNGEMKSCFLPMDDFELWEFDYAQLELRLGTAYADEPTLKAVFNEDRDIFEEMSGPMGMPRHQTKTFVYATQYGAGIKRIKNLFNITADKAADIRETYRAAYPGFHQKAQVAAYRATTNKKVKLWTGRYRHFFDPEKEAHKAWNSVIQGGAADIVERAMIRVFNNVDDEETCRMLLTVHDSIVVEIRKDKLDECVPKIIAEMENVGDDFGVRFKVEAKRFGAK